MGMIKTIPTDEPGTILRSDRGRWTYDDLQQIGETQDRYEIIDGVLYMSPSPHIRRHQSTVGNLYFLLRNWADDNDAGEVFLSPADVVVSPERVVQPDLFFVAAGRLDIVDAYVSEAPDLVVEVLSPASVKYDRETKFGLYEDIGVKEYWIADPEKQQIDVFARREGQFEADGRYAARQKARSVLLEGFSADVADVFA